MILRPYGGACYLYIGIGWPGLKKMGVEISEVLKLQETIIVVVGVADLPVVVHQIRISQRALVIPGKK